MRSRSGGIRAACAPPPHFLKCCQLFTMHAFLTVAQGLSKFVTCFYGDAYANCFASLPEKVDAMFLDLPKPW
jgi:hypothetical protein